MTAPPNQAFPLKLIRVISAVVTGVIAATGYLGVLGLLGGSLTFGETINARLPFGSRGIAGVALLIIVAGPMTVATVALLRRTRGSADLMFGAGLLLVAWIAVQLAFIEAYSWFQPTYLALACVVLALGWLLARGGVSQLGAGASNADNSADITGRSVKPVAPTSQ